MDAARSNRTGQGSADLNADAGESYGTWRKGRDDELFPLVTSVNLACGFHAGDPATMLRAAQLARRHGVAVGAHPGYPDLVGFGRRSMEISPEQVGADVLYQLGALDAIVRSTGGKLHHVKSHGALYMRMSVDEEVTEAVARSVATFDDQLPLVVLAGSEMERWSRDRGVATIPEAFPDRAYLASGRLAPRSMAGALIESPEEVGERAVRMTRGEPIDALDGGSVSVFARTLCLHGDNDHAVEAARAVRSAFEAADIRVAAY